MNNVSINNPTSEISLLSDNYLNYIVFGFIIIVLLLVLIVNIRDWFIKRILNYKTSNRLVYFI